MTDGLDEWEARLITVLGDPVASSSHRPIAGRTCSGVTTLNGRSGMLIRLLAGYPHAMECPECGQQMEWTPNEDDVEGGWYQCPANHRYRKGPYLEPVPVS